MVTKIATHNSQEQRRWIHLSSHRNQSKIQNRHKLVLHKASPNKCTVIYQFRKRHQSSDLYSIQKLQPQPASSSNRYSNNGGRARTPKK